MIQKKKKQELKRVSYPLVRLDYKQNRTEKRK